MPKPIVVKRTVQCAEQQEFLTYASATLQDNALCSVQRCKKILLLCVHGQALVELLLLHPKHACYILQTLLVCQLQQGGIASLAEVCYHLLPQFIFLHKTGRPCSAGLQQEPCKSILSSSSSEHISAQDRHVSMLLQAMLQCSLFGGSTNWEKLLHQNLPYFYAVTTTQERR